MRTNYKEKLEKINKILQLKKTKFEFEDYSSDFSESLKALMDKFEKLDTEFYGNEVNLLDELEKTEKMAQTKEDGIQQIDFDLLQSEDYDASFWEFVSNDLDNWIDEAIDYIQLGFEDIEETLTESDKENKKDFLNALEDARNELMDFGKEERKFTTINGKQPLNDHITDLEKDYKDFIEAESELDYAINDRDNFDMTADLDDEEAEEDRQQEYDDLESAVVHAQDHFDEVEKKVDDVFRDIEYEAADLKETLSKITGSREEFHGFVIDKMHEMESDFHELISILQEYNEEYVNNNAMNFKKFSEEGLENFIKKKQTEESIDIELTLGNKGSKLNNMIMFKDHSVLFMDKENKPFALNYETKADLADFCRSAIHHELRKIPKWQPLFEDYFEKHCIKSGADFTEIIEAIDGLKQYNNVFKQEKIEPSYFMEKKNRKFEDFMDKLGDVKKKSEINKIVKNIFTGKYKDLLDEKSYEFFESWYDNGFDEKTIKAQLAGKIASFKDSDSLNHAFRKITNDLFKWGRDLYIGKAEKHNAQVVFDSEDALILKISDFAASKELGSQSWCISRTASFFKNYTSSNDQYFVFDFERDPEDVRSLVGITLNAKMGNFRASHLKNDKSTNAKAQSDWICHILLNEEKPNKDFTIKSLKSFAEYYPEKFVKFWGNNHKEIKALNLDEETMKGVLYNLPPDHLDTLKKTMAPVKRKATMKP